ncbi:MAG TPA: sensor domain-containing diguanylate cyclase [Candidatus Wunengus sp. YC63]|uniref:sensor domain-containing diguanylate cyclase n=1 Tax=unclassified Candidatus Wunengus TaxID=3367695 RepID=UPI00402536E0
MDNNLLSFEEYRILVEQAPIMIWRSNTTTACDYFNERWLAFTGRTIEQEMENGWAAGVHPEDLDKCLKIYLDTFQKREVFEMEYRLRRHDGQYRWIFDRGVPFKGHNGQFAGYIGSCIDVTEKVEAREYLQKIHRKLESIVNERTAELRRKQKELEDLNEALEKQAITDTLTEVYNRQKFHEMLIQETKESRRYNTHLSLIMFDIDHFKLVNDTYGHQAGDAVLKETAKLISKNIRDADLLARYGGEEFMILTPQTDRESAFTLAEKLRETIRTTKFNGVQHVTCSFGVTQFHGRDTIDSFLKRIDDALYRAKNNGRNRVEML